MTRVADLYYTLEVLRSDALRTRLQREHKGSGFSDVSLDRMREGVEAELIDAVLYQGYSSADRLRRLSA